jgi:hypothetical protein
MLNFRSAKINRCRYRSIDGSVRRKNAQLTSDPNAWDGDQTAQAQTAVESTARLTLRRLIA